MPEPLEPIADAIPAACIRLSISRSTLYLELASGALRGVKVRGRTLITREAQLDWLNSLPAMTAGRAA